MPEGNVSTTFTGDSRDFERKVDQMQRKIDTLTARLKKTGDESKRTKQAQDDAFGSQSLSRLGSYLAGVVSVTTALAGMRQAFVEIDRMQTKAAQKQMANFGSLGKLQQVATGTADFQWMLERTAKTFAVTGDWAKSANLTFMLRSGGMLGNAQAGETGTRALFAQLMASGFIESPDAMAEAAAKWMSALGTAETGTIQQILSKGVAASGIAVGTIEQLMGSSARAGAMAAQVGISDEELITAAAVASKTLGADEAGIYIRSMLSDLGKAGYTGKPLMQLLDQVQAEGRTNIFGDVRSKTAVGLLTGAESRSLYAQTLADVQAANTRNLISERSGLFKGSPNLTAAQLRTQTGAELELTQEQFGRRRNLEEAYIDVMKNYYLQKIGFATGEGVIREVFQRFMTQGAFLTSARGELESLGEFDPAARTDSVVNLLRSIDSELKRMGRETGALPDWATTSPTDAPTGNEQLRGAM